MAQSHPGQGKPSDEQAVAQVLAGRTQAFEVLVERHKALVAGIVRGKVPREQAAEVAHEVFIRAFQSLGNYRPLKPFSHWLSVIAVRACHDFWRERYRNRETTQADLSEEQLAWLEGVAAGLDQGEQQRAQERFEAWELVDWALSHLSPRDRLALTLVHLEGRSTAEAAEFLGLSVANLKVRVFRSRQKLRALIEDELNRGGK